MNETIVSREDVLLHFLIMEGKMEELLRSYLTWEAQYQSKTAVADTPLKLYVDSRKDVNPALLYLIGIGNDKRCDKVDSWRLMKIPTAEIYTCGINESVNQKLETVKGNLSDFALNYAHQYSEFAFRITNNVNYREALIIVAQQTTKGKKGNYELLDGAHRLVNICHQGGKEVLAFVAKMKSDKQ